MSRKTLLGPKLRRLRQEHGLTQAQTAQRLGISPSYLNMIESNQRSVTIDLLLKIGQSFDVDLARFADDDGARLISGLQEVFADPLFDGQGVKRQDILDMVETAPAAARSVMTLYQAYRQLRDDAKLAVDARASADGTGGAQTGGTGGFALDETVDFFYDQSNHFPALEDIADSLWAGGGLDAATLYGSLVEALDRDLSLRVKVMPVDVMGPAKRRYDRHSRRVLLSEMLPPESRTFELALQLGQLRYRDALDAVADSARFRTEEAGRLARLALANYLAGAILMPYDRFYRAAVAVRYDLEILQQRFGASFEQVCHRLTTLQRPGARGVPFFLIRVDKAGNVSKRFTGKGLHFARFGGACPRWNIHDALQAQGRMVVQMSETLEGERYFSIARSVTKPGGGWREPGQTYAVALACEASHAAQLVYADGMDLQTDQSAVPIGLHCRVCERLECAHRAFPPVGGRVVIDDPVRADTAAPVKQAG